MYNLLIVDDENAVVNGLAYDIDWNDLNIGEKFKAYDGAQAVELLKKNRIDVVISDIRMPEIDGLELADIIKKQWPHAKVIFISGYNEFEYAKKAVDLGVYSYILKPASDDEIKEAVRKAIEETEREISELETLVRAEKQLKETIPLLQERYLNAWIVQGRSGIPKELEQWVSGILSYKNESRAFLILVREDEVEHDMEQNGTFEIVAKNLIQKILLKDEHGIMFKDPEGNHVILMQKEDEQELEELRQYVLGSAETFQLSVTRSLGCTVSIFCGEAVPIADLHKSYKKVVSLMHRSFRLYSGVILGSETPILQFESNRSFSLPGNSEFVLLLETLQKERCIKCIDEMFQEVEQIENIPYEVLLEIYFTVGNTIIQDSNKRGIPMAKWAGDEDERCFSNFENLKSFEEVKCWCRRSIERYIDFAVRQEKGHTHHLVEESKKFIIDNLHNDISLADIAAQLYVHPNYLCRLFKEEEGFNITDYMTKLRIEKAKKLLKGSGMKVYEVAENVGYLSVAHFNRTFKRETGMSPKDYQISQL